MVREVHALCVRCGMHRMPHRKTANLWASENLRDVFGIFLQSHHLLVFEQTTVVLQIDRHALAFLALVQVQEHETDRRQQVQEQETRPRPGRKRGMSITPKCCASSARKHMFKIRHGIMMVTKYGESRCSCNQPDVTRKEEATR